nr:MAG TPA: hypothetical protein [Caudoviricetes sp.]
MCGLIIYTFLCFSFKIDPFLCFICGGLCNCFALLV